MTAKYFAILTNQGAARLANAAALGTKLNLTQMAVGDANGTLPTPDPAQTKLINQKRIAPLNLLTVDPANTSQIIAEQIIPENEGGFWIREIGLYDDDGILIAVANCPETYKPQLQEGSGRTQTIRMMLIVSSTSAITLKIDPSVVLATRQYVDDKIIEVKAYADDLMKKHVEAANPHKQYLLIANALKEIADAGLSENALRNLGVLELISKLAPLESPSLTGTPTVPTAEQSEVDFRVANTAFVAQAIAILKGGVAVNLNTLNKIARAINNDPDFFTSISSALNLKAPLDSPSMTGTPTVPTAKQTEIDLRVANTAFVAQALSELNGGAPAALNTLKKLASAINNDANFFVTLNNALSQKALLSDFSSAKTSTSIVGNQPGGLRFMCGETSVPTDANGNAFITLPDTFLGRVVYAEAHQSKNSYTADTEPFIFSSYPSGVGPVSTVSFAVRSSKTGAALINSAINLTYFVRGY
ncbi:phage tail protein [Citrobacter portucalensis]|uniref:phage tail protein n=1 Tax=Citrobacter portucalensis TaxID=1639133 RepID=UPI0038D21AF0